MIVWILVERTYELTTIVGVYLRERDAQAERERLRAAQGPFDRADLDVEEHQVRW
jgi:hypothetical protein